MSTDFVLAAMVTNVQVQGEDKTYGRIAASAAAAASKRAEKLGAASSISVQNADEIISTSSLFSSTKLAITFSLVFSQRPTTTSNAD